MKLLAVALATLHLLPSISLAQSAPALDGRLKKIHDTRSIAIAHRTDAAPFSFEENKQVVGYSIDLCATGRSAPAGLTELKIKWVPVTVQNRLMQSPGRRSAARAR
jgi:ABC-type amino acid transport substrate-binding protein